ncbi:MAG: helix-hairpin-helix domain-containing protein [Synergistaceae bacterium]|nr:helix-hairpin-helix domain-containing protein [Synergistaceae bacterium]
MIYSILGAACIAAVFIIALTFRGENAPRKETTIVVEAPEMEDMETQAPETWAVYVTGEVKFPGVYEIAPGSRVNDAVGMAGGFTAKADRDSVNLAAKLMDEAHVVITTIPVPSPGDVPKQSETQRPGNPQTRPDSFAGQTQGGVSYPRQSQESGEISKIDINTADASLLSTLPGIGPKLSLAIVAHREENGPFGSPEDLRSVRGIGGKRFDALRELITVSN